MCRMLYQLVGDSETFKECLKVYMYKYQYSNTKTEDLLAIMDNVSGKDITGVMLPWLNQPCFPELCITRVSNNTFKLS
jgi:aminopeptidase N